MKEDMEQGFLANKFDDWSSEPIPNGWKKINQVIEVDRNKPNRKPMFFILGLAFLGLISGGLFLYNQNLKTETTLNMVRANSQIEIQSIGSSDPVQTIQSRISEEKVPQVSSLGPKEQNSSKVQSMARLRKGVEKVAVNPVVSNFSNQQSEHKNSKTYSQKVGVPAFANVYNQDSKRTPEILDETHENQLIAQVEDQSNGGQIGIPTDIEGPIGVNESSDIASRIDEGKLAGLPNSPMPENIEFLQTRLTDLEVPSTDFQIVVNRVQLVRDFPITKKLNPCFYSVGVSVGYAPRSIEINQNETVSNLAVLNSGKSIQSWFGNVGFSVQNELKPWIRSFASLKLGVMSHSISMIETGKNPSGFVMSMADSTNFKMIPTWDQTSGKMNQELIYSTIEFGLNPFLIPSKQSGPFASAAIWVALSQTIHSNLIGASTGLQDSRENVALSYRLGYQHVFAGFIRGEIYMAGMPDKILANSKGLSIKPQLVGMGFHYIFH